MNTFRRLSQGNCIDHFLGLKMEEGTVYKFSTDYTYIEIPLLRAVNADGESVQKATRNQYTELVSSASVRLYPGMKGLAVANPILSKYGAGPNILLLDNSSTREQVVVPITFRKDMQLTGLDWLVRLYLFQ